MINTFDYIQKYPLRAKRLLGINYEQFTDLVNAAQKYHEEEQRKLEQSKVRIYRPGGGRKEILSIPEQVCLCVFYLRQIPTFEVLGMLFGVSKTEANDTFHYWRKILRQIISASLLEQVEDKPGDLAIVQEILTSFKLLVDSLEQPIDRPSDNDEQQKFFSGKKRQHTKKSQVASLPKAQDLIDIKVGLPGPTADINIYRERQINFDEQQQFEGDKAYQGGSNITTPHKKKRRQELSEAVPVLAVPGDGELPNPKGEQQKAENKILSSKRIFVEHLIRIIKIFQIASQRFRLDSDVYNEIILTVCGLVRLRIGALVL